MPGPTEEQKKTLDFLDFFIDYLNEEDKKKKSNKIRQISEKVIEINAPRYEKGKK